MSLRTASHEILLIALALGLAACDDSRRGSSGGGDNTPGRDAGVTRPHTACGNGVLNGTEACDGTTFKDDATCASLGLGTGDLRCSSTCTLDVSSCTVKDYCTAKSLYGNGACDPCDLLGGVRDPDCDTACGADGQCADRFDDLTSTWTCRRLGKTDPDCGTCGNNVIDGNELCDGHAFQPDKFTCESYGFLAGTLSCKSDCTPNFSQCTFSVCGDGTIEGSEECEGTDFQGVTCESRGQAGGQLTCTASCRISDETCVAPGCNNGIVEAARSEDCDGQNLNNQTCASLGFAGGNLACSGTCSFDTSACVTPGCGNGVIEAPIEQCEGSNLGGASCQSLGFLQGDLRCSESSCTHDTSGCIAPGCGNGIIESASEQCEGTNLNGATCTSLGFAAGNVTCNSSCRYDTSACLRAGCGNGVLEAGENCDGTNLGGATCESIGYPTGTLACDSSCHFDIQNCYGLRSFCGDGKKDALEACDGNDFGRNSRSCADYNLGTGTVTCQAATCRLMFDNCTTPDPCEGGWYGDGICDLCDYYSMMGHRDPDCGDAVREAACGADGVCAEYFDGLVGAFGCELIQGHRDPDCGCGDGQLAPPSNGLTIEFCDGSTFGSSTPQACTAWGFSSGTISCGEDCAPNFELCY